MMIIINFIFHILYFVDDEIHNKSVERKKARRMERNPNLHSEEQDGYEIPDGSFFFIICLNLILFDY